MEKAKNNPKTIVWKRTSHLKRYGLSEDDINQMIERQNGRCAICGEIPIPKVKASAKKKVNHLLYVDHNHKTGITRGLLCRQCNAKLAPLENQEFILKARDYLKSYDDWNLG